MNITQKIILVFGIIIGTILLSVVIVFLVMFQERKFSKKSTLLQSLDQFNSYYHDLFCWSLRPIELTFQCKNKAEFDRIRIHDWFCSYIENNIDSMEKLSEKLSINQNHYKNYLEQCEKLPQTDESVKGKREWIRKAFSRYELREYKKMLLKPPVTLLITVYKQYTSPQGRNSYSDCSTYDEIQFLEIINYCKKRIKEKNSQEAARQKERAKVTAKVRYLVMQRDNNRCVLCGAKASETITLHVDHIIPISKGGTSELSNLRTLCNLCNLGKGNLSEE